MRHAPKTYSSTVAGQGAFRVYQYWDSFQKRRILLNRTVFEAPIEKGRIFFYKTGRIFFYNATQKSRIFFTHLTTRNSGAKNKTTPIL